MRKIYYHSISYYRQRGIVAVVQNVSAVIFASYAEKENVKKSNNESGLSDQFHESIFNTSRCSPSEQSR